MSEQSGHLKYYRAQGISPVRYQMRSLSEHFDRRDSLYRTIGLPPAAFKGCRVLEVAPGSGQNSLYVASLAPASLDLVEPNPAGMRDLKALYDEYQDQVVRPTLHHLEFEAFDSPGDYDIVLCENWLGSLPSELALVGKLADLTAPGGVMVMTIVPYSGFFPNVLRRIMALRLLDPSASFAERTRLMVDMFGLHLASIANMTRSYEHWVQDCVLNPHYLNVALPLDTVLGVVGDRMEALGSSPRFVGEWRWFKGLTGEGRDFNGAFQRGYLENIHNFIDYRRLYAPRTAEENAPIERICRDLHREALAWEAAWTKTGAADGAPIATLLEELAPRLAEIDPELRAAVAEFAALWRAPAPSLDAVRDMRHFSGLFGRETIYLSLTRRQPD